MCFKLTVQTKSHTNNRGQDQRLFRKSSCLSLFYNHIFIVFFCKKLNNNSLLSKFKARRKKNLKLSQKNLIKIKVTFVTDWCNLYSEFTTATFLLCPSVRGPITWLASPWVESCKNSTQKEITKMIVHIYWGEVHGPLKKKMLIGNIQVKLWTLGIARHLCRFNTMDLEA